MAGSKPATHTLYDQLVAITYEYFGPAADRYIARQIESHLGKDPEELQTNDLGELIAWIKIATTHLIDDEELVNEYIGKLQDLKGTAATT